MQDLIRNSPFMINIFAGKNRRAMTLAELAMALALVALSIGGIISVLFQSSDLAQAVDSSYVAAELARNRIERIREVRRDMGYDSIPEAAETDTIVDRNGDSDQDGDFKRTTIIDASYGTNLTKVVVRVTYKRKGSSISTPVEVTSLISPYT